MWTLAAGKLKQWAVIWRWKSVVLKMEPILSPKLISRSNMNSLVRYWTASLEKDGIKVQGSELITGLKVMLSAFIRLNIGNFLFFWYLMSDKCFDNFKSDGQSTGRDEINFDVISTCRS